MIFDVWIFRRFFCKQIVYKKFTLVYMKKRQIYDYNHCDYVCSDTVENNNLITTASKYEFTKNTLKKRQEYFCELCNFKCSKQSEWNRHILTAKHDGFTKRRKNAENIVEHVCNMCNKIYKSRMGLWKHKQKCEKKLEVVNRTDSNIHIDSELITKLLLQNQELILSNQKLQTQLLEVTKDTGNITNNTVHNTTNNNQKFNLNFFLNTTCKDAMNMSEFIENIEVNLKDIENIGKNGYVSGMTDMILSRIKELDITKRPMHCTDLKRETMYIKDNNEWKKDTPENTKLHKMIDYVAKQNYAKMPLWRQRNPECLDSDHPKYDFCIKMMRNMLGDVGAEQVRLDNKVIKNLSKHIFVDKAVN